MSNLKKNAFSTGTILASSAQEALDPYKLRNLCFSCSSQLCKSLKIKSSLNYYSFTLCFGAGRRSFLGFNLLNTQTQF